MPTMVDAFTRRHCPSCFGFFISNLKGSSYPGSKRSYDYSHSTILARLQCVTRAASCRETQNIMKRRRYY